jgi:hypothetical protein
VGAARLNIETCGTLGGVEDLGSAGVVDQGFPTAVWLPAEDCGGNEGLRRLALDVHLDVDELWKIKTGSVGRSKAIAALLEDRNEGP